MKMRMNVARAKSCAARQDEKILPASTEQTGQYRNCAGLIRQA